MKAVAALAVLALIVVAFVQGYKTISQGGGTVSAFNTRVNASAVAKTGDGGINWQFPIYASTSSESAVVEDPDGLSNIAENVSGALLGSYAALAEGGTYTPEEGEKIAEDIAASLKASVSYPMYSAADLKTDSDTSYERMLAYRSDLRIALEPLLKNPGYELGIFANYIESREVRYLEELHATAANYRLAVEGAANIVVPVDASAEHVAILNALSEFGTIVDRLARYADDAFASAALLRTYQSSESNLLVSFNKLTEYYRSKQS